MNAPEPRWMRKGYNVEAMRVQARAALPRSIFDFADGGAEEEYTLQRNERAFEELELLPQPLRGAAMRDQSVTLFGKRLSMPVVIGPTGLSGLFWPDGECCTARAAAAAGTAFCLSHGSVCTLEKLAGATAAPKWMQVFIYTDKGFTRELVQRAASAGYDALVLTVDNQLLGNRERDKRNGFSIPPRLNASTLAGMASKTGWLWRMRKELRHITFGNYVKAGETARISELAGRMASLLDPSMSWSDVEAVRKLWPGPLILKGLLSPQEAATAVKLGIDGIVVSNHGGRQLDGAPATLEALPPIVDVVAGNAAVLLDGGVRRGADVVKALALGAKACLIGRPQLWGLAVSGEAGVAHVLDLYRREIDRVMGLCGISSIAEIGRDTLFHKASRSAP
jgi:L-lactate dehydrogenase (cytochrome)